MAADTTAELYVGDHPVSESNPIPTAPAAGSGDTTVDQGAPGASAWPVDDDATQAVLTAMAGGKSLNDVIAELQVIAATKTLADIITALGFSKNAGAVDANTLRVVNASDGPTVAALGTTADAAAGDANASINAHVRQAAKALNGGLPAGLGAHGGLVVEGVASGVAQPVDSELPAAAALSDTDGNPTAPYVGAAGMRWDITNGVWVRHRATARSTLVSSAARTASSQTAAFSAYTWRGLHLYINITAYTAGSLTVAFQVFDATANNYMTIATTQAITAAGSYILSVHPGAAVLDANPLWSRPVQIPESWRLSLIHGDSTSITYSVAAHYLP